MPLTNREYLVVQDVKDQYMIVESFVLEVVFSIKINNQNLFIFHEKILTVTDVKRLISNKCAIIACGKQHNFFAKPSNIFKQSS